MKNNKDKIRALTGGEAAAEAMRQINPAVFSAYPITPQTPIIEKFAGIVAKGLVDTKFVPVESEHSAMSLVVGASAAGGRAMTATASQGLALMSEILPIASGMRLPIVMNLVTRALSAPINIHNDHQDAMLARDLGWIQIFCENNQEIYENNFLATRLAEDKRVKLPVMICQDGFIASHNVEGVKLYNDEIIKEYLGEYKPENFLLNLEKPITMGPLALPDYYFEIKAQLAPAMKRAEEVYLELGEQLTKITGHHYGYFEGYFLDDAEVALVIMGSTAGTGKVAVDELRAQGKKVGLLKLNLFRPFPEKEVAQALSKVKFVGVLERTISFGSWPPLASDVYRSLSAQAGLQSYIFGLGGRDIGPDEIGQIFEELLDGKISREVKYIGLRSDNT